MTTSKQLLAFAQHFSADRPSVEVTGEYYDLPGEIMYTTATQSLAGGGRIEVNSIAPNAPADFEWKYEITINDKAKKQFIHLIIRRDFTAAETYGKTVIPIHSGREQEIMKTLTESYA